MPMHITPVIGAFKMIHIFVLGYDFTQEKTNRQKERIELLKRPGQSLA